MNSCLPAARLSKLTLFDDNSSFFSRSSFLKHDNTDHSHAMTNAQLPDLLNGTLNNSNSMGLDSKQILKNLGSFGSSEPHDDWESAFKYIMSKNSFNNKHYDEQQQEDWMRFQESRKHPVSSSTNSGVGLNQFNNMFNSKSQFPSL